MLNHTDLEAFGLYDETVRAAPTPANRIVRQFRQIVLWPLQLVGGLHGLWRVYAARRS